MTLDDSHCAYATITRESTSRCHAPARSSAVARGRLRLRDDVPLAAIPAAAWDALAAGQPLLSHAFLTALHDTGCASAATGWPPRYLTAWDGDALVGALPLYAKTHSYGEYVFDWAWADAYRRHGRRYYPKLVAAIPFTPATGRAAARAGRRRRARGAARRTRAAARAAARSRRCTCSSRPTTEAAPVRSAGHDDPPRRPVPLGQSRLPRLRRLPRGVQPRQAQEGEAGAAQARRGGRHLRAQDRARDLRRRLGVLPPLLRAAPTTRTARRRTSRSTSSSASARRCRSTCCWWSARATAGPICAALDVFDRRHAVGPLLGRDSSTCRACTSRPATTRRSSSASSAASRRFEGGAQGIHKLARGLLPVTTSLGARDRRSRTSRAAIADFCARERARSRTPSTSSRPRARSEIAARPRRTLRDEPATRLRRPIGAPRAPRRHVIAAAALRARRSTPATPIPSPTRPSPARSRR